MPKYSVAINKLFLPIYTHSACIFPYGDGTLILNPQPPLLLSSYCLLSSAVSLFVCFFRFLFSFSLSTKHPTSSADQDKAKSICAEH